MIEQDSQSQAVHSQTGFTLRRFNIDVDKGDLSLSLCLPFSS